MEVQKTVLCRLESYYALEVAELDGTPWYVAASEAKQPCYAFSVQDTAHRQTLWEQPGGCMNIIQIPDGSEEFLAIQRFYSLYQWEEAQLVWVYRDDAGRFQSKVLTRIPYIHRIDVLRDGKNCTLWAVLWPSTRTRWRTGIPEAGFTWDSSGLKPGPWRRSMRAMRRTPVC